MGTGCEWIASRPPLHAKGVIGCVRAGLLAWRVGHVPYGSGGLPMRMHSGRRLSSLTVARQRGILTRFPVRDERHGRANFRLQRTPAGKLRTGTLNVWKKQSRVNSRNRLVGRRLRELVPERLAFRNGIAAELHYPCPSGPGSDLTSVLGRA